MEEVVGSNSMLAAQQRFASAACGDLIHTWSRNSCTGGVWYFATSLFKASVKMYGLLFAIPALIKWRTLSAAKIWRVALDVLRSSTFLSSYGGLTLSLMCVLRGLLGRNFIMTSAFVPSFLASITLLIERKSRRADLGMYVATQGYF